MSEKIVILTGSFNPPSLAHLETIVSAMDIAGADMGYLVPTSYHYIKEKMTRAGDGFALSDSTRNSMLSAMCRADRRLVLGLPEIENSTHLTIAEIKKDNPDAQLYFIAGADKLSSMPHWDNIEGILSSVKIIVFDRGDRSAESLVHADRLLSGYKDSFIIAPALSENGDVSSTKIRALFKEGNKEYRNYLLPEVADILETINPSDYKDPDFTETIRALMRSGRFGIQNAFKRVYSENLKLFPDIKEKDSMLSGTAVYKEPFIMERESKCTDTVFGCFNTDLVSAAEDLAAEGLDPVIVSTAARTKACPGYRAGNNNLTEDELCRCSDLSLSLYRFGKPSLADVKESGVENVSCEYPLDIRFGCIYSPGVTFFRNGKRDFYSLRDKKFVCSVISAASLTNRDKEKDKILISEKEYFTPHGNLTEEGAGILKDKIRTILRVALSNGHSSICIGDFGIKYHMLKGEELAASFSAVFSEPEFEGKFKKIVFAFDEGRESRRNPVGISGRFSAFYRIYLQNRYCFSGKNPGVGV